jgi:hypothetical protein
LSLANLVAASVAKLVVNTVSAAARVAISEAKAAVPADALAST